MLSLPGTEHCPLQERAAPAQFYLKRSKIHLKLRHREGKKLKQKKIPNHYGMKAKILFTKSLPIPPL